jgi:predicted dehydrogenase
VDTDQGDGPGRPAERLTAAVPVGEPGVIPTPPTGSVCAPVKESAFWQNEPVARLHNDTHRARWCTIDTSAGIPRVVITGVRGFGARHLANARRLQAAGRLSIVAVADPVAAADGEIETDDGIPVYADLPPALAGHPADIVIVATPLDTHARLCAIAMEAGADVLLEKPPVPSRAEFDRLLRLQQQTGAAVQVGFQSLGSHALRAFETDAFELGELVSVSATGLWSRARGYWSRSRWAGKRVLDGHAVVDGVATNPLAHAVATALWIAGYRDAQSVDAVDTELYRANAIEADDTSVIRVSGRGGVPVTCALTLCAPLTDAEDRGATVTVRGSRRSATFAYTADVVHVDGERQVVGRDDLLENLIEHRRAGVELVAPLHRLGAFMQVVEAIRSAPEPTAIDPAYVRWRGAGDEAVPVIDDIQQWCALAASQGKTFSELGAPWAHGRRDSVLARAVVAGRGVADYLDGAATIPFSSPRPYLHPVRTLGGIRVTAAHPADHDWHLGVGFAVQDAAGVNFWGGRTFVAGRGYQRVNDNGHVESDSIESHADGLTQSLTWRAPDDVPVLRERRSIAWSAAAGTDEDGDVDEASGWLLTFESALTPAGDAPVELASPGSKGRESAGYGGLFWRMPPCRDVSVFTADAEGEESVNGSRAPWLAWTAEFLAAPGECGPATIVLLPGDAPTARDPWFVRAASYPGIGSAVAWQQLSVVGPAGWVRRYRALIVDGRLTRAEVHRRTAALGAGVTA